MSVKPFKNSLMSAALTVTIVGAALQSPLTAFSADHQSSRTHIKSVASISYQPLLGHGGPLVKVRLNNVVGVFLVDTGSNMSLLSTQMADKLGFKNSLASADLVPGNAGNIRMPTVQVRRVRLGTMALSSAEFAIVGKDTFSFLPGKPIDGTIGNNVLAALAMRIDHSSHRITLWNTGDLNEDDLRSIGFTSVTAVPMVDAAKVNVYSVMVDLVSTSRQTAEALLVDTGANSTRISYSTAAALGLRSAETEGDKNILNQTSFVMSSRTKSVTLGDLTLNDFPLNFMSQNMSRDASPLLGMDFLSHCDVLVDYPARKMYLKCR